MGPSASPPTSLPSHTRHYVVVVGACACICTITRGVKDLCRELGFKLRVPGWVMGVRSCAVVLVLLARRATSECSVLYGAIVCIWECVCARACVYTSTLLTTPHHTTPSYPPMGSAGFGSAAVHFGNSPLFGTGVGGGVAEQPVTFDGSQPLVSWVDSTPFE